MNFYRVTLNGSNFRFKDQPEKMAFITVRFMEAADSEEAENVAVGMLRRDEELRGMVLNDRSDPPILRVHDMVQVVGVGTNTGFIFYPDADAVRSAESDAFIGLGQLLKDGELTEVSMEWIKTDPNTEAPNALIYDTEKMSLTHRTPSEIIVYGPVWRDVIEQMAKRAEAGKAVAAADVMNNGAVIVRKEKKGANGNA